MGTERGETRGPGQPATGAAPKNLHGAEQGIVSRMVGGSAHRWREQGLANHVLRQQVKERKAIADAELEHLRAKEWRAYEQCNAEFRKQERYCKEQRDVLRALEDLKEQERTMYEIDNRKDQVMTVCKVALAILAMWVCDHYFPPSYAQATWKRLLPFFQLPGTNHHTGRHSGGGSNSAHSTTACSIETCSSYGTASISLHPACPMDAASRSPSGPLVAFLLRRKWGQYRDSLIM